GKKDRRGVRADGEVHHGWSSVPHVTGRAAWLSVQGGTTAKVQVSSWPHVQACESRGPDAKGKLRFAHNRIALRGRREGGKRKPGCGAAPPGAPRQRHAARTGERTAVYYQYTACCARFRSPRRVARACFFHPHHTLGGSSLPGNDRAALRARSRSCRVQSGS